MLNPVKNDYWVCPKCGSDNCECYDDEFDDGYVVRKMACYHCDHTWREYFKIAYDGYSDESGEYDENGVCVESYEVNEDESNDEGEDQ